MSTTANRGPLSGIRILDLTSIVLGPLATLTMAELGAEVIKVESPEGDNVREAGVMKNGGMGHVFLHGNRGKKSLVLNLKKEAGREALVRLSAQCDVFFTNVRPAAMKRLGLDDEALRAANPRLIYVSACGYSSKGPYADKPAYDDLIQGAVGVPWLMQRYGSPEPAYAPVSLADRVTGLHAAYAICAALYAREKTGTGQSVEVPMFESVAHFILADHAAGRTFSPSLGAAGYDRLLSHSRRPYKTADGYLCVLIYNDKQWQRFFQLIGKPEQFVEDERFSSQRNRSANIDAVYAWVADTMRSHTTDDWERLLSEADIPNQRIRSLDDLLADPQLWESGFFKQVPHPSEGDILTINNVIQWSETPSGPLGPAPRLGEHSAAVLELAGYSPEEIVRMCRDGATAQA